MLPWHPLEAMERTGDLMYHVFVVHSVDIQNGVEQNELALVSNT